MDRIEGGTGKRLVQRFWLVQDLRPWITPKTFLLRGQVAKEKPSNPAIATGAEGAFD
jgi:hypothetical protein